MKFLFFIVMYAGAVYAEPERIGFDELPQNLNKVIEIRGFAYKSSQMGWILAGEPHLKSCCVGAVHHQNRQVRLDLDSLPVNRAVLLKGILIEKQGYFHLQNTLVVNESGNSLVWIIGILFLIPIFFWIYRSCMFSAKSLNSISRYFCRVIGKVIE